MVTFHVLPPHHPNPLPPPGGVGAFQALALYSLSHNGGESYDEGELVICFRCYWTYPYRGCTCRSLLA